MRATQEPEREGPQVLSRDRMSSRQPGKHEKRRWPNETSSQTESVKKVECLPGMCEAPGSIPGIEKKKKKTKLDSFLYSYVRC